uniref:Uncharacterized protein n=1 Tax=Daphnia magna TaxID=35525 RepID=A0A0N8CMU8_9CRUS
MIDLNGFLGSNLLISMLFLLKMVFSLFTVQIYADHSSAVGYCNIEICQHGVVSVSFSATDLWPWLND